MKELALVPAGEHGLCSSLNHGASWRSIITREQLFTGLFVLAGANGLAHRVFGAASISWFEGATEPLNTSVIIWLAWVAALSLLMRNQTDDVIRKSDLIVGSIAFVLIACPFAAPSWWALSGLAVYVIWNSPSHSMHQRGSLILLAVTAPMYWGQIVRDILGYPLLQLDALFVSFLIGTAQTGNLVEFANGSGPFVVMWPCSSFHNISLALVAWMAAARWVGRRWSPMELGWGAILVVSVFLVNGSRLSLIGLYREHFELLHGPIGSGIAEWISVSLILLVCFLGIRRESLIRA
jgi:hypothetical protein